MIFRFTTSRYYHPRLATYEKFRDRFTGCSLNILSNGHLSNQSVDSHFQRSFITTGVVENENWGLVMFRLRCQGRKWLAFYSIFELWLRKYCFSRRKLDIEYLWDRIYLDCGKGRIIPNQFGLFVYLVTLCVIAQYSERHNVLITNNEIDYMMWEFRGPWS